MKKSNYPTRIRLDEISENGDDFLYSRASGELNDGLKDLIGARNFEARIHLKPMGNVYEITCDFETSMGLNCCRCGRNTDKEVRNNSTELLVIEDPRPRKAKNAQSSQEPSSSGLFCNYIPSTNFDIGEFIHEQMASNEPFLVECGEKDCVDVLKSFQAEVGTDKPNPFAALKDLKL